MTDTQLSPSAEVEGATSPRPVVPTHQPEPAAVRRRRRIGVVARPLVSAWRWVAGLVPERWRPWARGVLLAGYGLVFVAVAWLHGIPFDREQVILWICGGALISSLWRPQWWRLFTDWLPFVLLMAVYDRTRGAAETLGMPIQWEPQLEVDEFLFFGTVPTVWLQDRLAQPETQWWQVFTGVTYVSHFVVPLAVAGVLWVRNRTGFVAYARRFLTLSYLGLATYILFPAAPPWKAGEEGYIDPVSRLASRGWGKLGLERAQSLIERGQSTVNLYAAVPSLHAAYAMLVSVFLWNRARWWWRPLLAAYPVFMAFTLVFGGEHYVSDVLLGWAYVLAVVAGWTWWEKRRARQREAAAAHAPGSTAAPAAV